MARENAKLFHRGHYNILAKRFSEELDEWHMVTDKTDATEEELTLLVIQEGVVLAIRHLAEAMADRFAIDSDEFDRELWMTNCGFELGGEDDTQQH